MRCEAVDSFRDDFWAIRCRWLVLGFCVALTLPMKWKLGPYSSHDRPGGHARKARRLNVQLGLFLKYYYVAEAFSESACMVQIFFFCIRGTGVALVLA
jgi:hypothetical protein